MYLLARINEVIEAQERDELRNHLGGSLIGRKCNRQLWYTFRWAHKEKFSGRMLRLFDRGHKEEFRFVKYLVDAGIELRAYSQQLWYSESKDEYMLLDWDADLSGGTGDFVHVTNDASHVERAEKQGVHLKQWRILDVNGHFGGSLDGLGKAPFEIVTETVNGTGAIPANEEFLTEFKTHNTKSFVNMVASGVKDAKPEHYAQMQIYMHKRGLRHALYMAVNKNDDDLYCEVVNVDPAVGPKLLDKASNIINSKKPPDRIGNNPSWYDCKYCPFIKQCHYGEPMLRNCRTCVFSTPVEDGKWHCGKWDSIIPVDVLRKGCDNGYKAITD